MSRVETAAPAESFVAREYDPARDRPTLEAWFNRLLREWRDRSAFIDSCCEDRMEGSKLTFDGYVGTLFALFLVERKGTPIAIGGLAPMSGQPDAAYGSGYSVEPEYQGTAIGSLLYQPMIQKLIDLGYHRLVIRTQPDNSEATPIYKASGTFWVPGTAAWWENYLPLLWRHPQMVSFCSAHRLDVQEWIRCYFKTALQVRPQEIRRHAPDEYLYRDQLVFPYYWRVGEDELIFRVGAECRDVISVTRGPLTVDCLLESTSTTLRCAVENRGSRRQALTLTFLKGATHKNWAARLVGTTPTVQAGVGADARFARTFQLRPTADTRHALAIVIQMNHGVFPFVCQF